MADEEWPRHLKYKIDYINQLNNQLLQRVNYFLVGIAFLVTAFVALIIAKGFQWNSYFVCLAVLICSAGYILSLFFTVMNYRNSNLYLKFAKKLNKHPYYNYVQWTDWIWKSVVKSDDEFKINNFLKNICAIIKDPENSQKRELNVPHVWLVPFIFTIFWWLILLGLAIYVIGGFSMIILSIKVILSIIIISLISIPIIFYIM